MATLQAFAGTNDGNLRCNNATYLTARSGAGTMVVATTGSNAAIGQESFSGQYYCYQSFFEFDTSSLGASAIVSAAVLSIYHNNALTTSSSFVAEARLYDWGGTVTSADWIAGASWTGNTLLATIASGSITVSAYNNWTDVAFPANVNLTGMTRIVCSTDRFGTGGVPNTQEYTNTEMADHAGTTFDPYLTVTYTVPSFSPTDDLGASGFFGI